MMGGCMTKPHPVPPNMMLVKKIDVPELTRTTVRYTTKMERLTKIHLEDSRVYYTDCTEKIRLVLSSQNLYEINDCRILITDYVEGYLNALNNNPSIRADMCSEPFTPDDLDIHLNFESFFGQFVDPFYIGCVELNDGLVDYYLFTLKQYHYDRWHTRVEPYWKALEIANAQKEAEMIYPVNMDAGAEDEQLPSRFVDTGGFSRNH